MAKASFLQSFFCRTDPDDEDDEIRELEDLQRKQSTPEELTLLDRGKLFVEELVAKVGFLGILACASVRKSFLLFCKNFFQPLNNFLDTQSSF